MRLLTYEDLIAQKGIRYSKVQLWRKMKDGSFPAALKVGAARNAWLESDIDGWIEGLVAQRDAKRDGAA